MDEIDATALNLDTSKCQYTISQTTEVLLSDILLISNSLTSHSLRLLFNSSHLRSLQICLPVFRFKQFAQVPQFSLRRQGTQAPHFFLRFFCRSMAASRESSKGEREKSPACWCSLSMYLLRGDIFSADFRYKWRDWASSESMENSIRSSGGGAGPTLGLGMVNVLPYVNYVFELKGFVEFKRIGKSKINTATIWMYHGYLAEFAASVSGPNNCLTGENPGGNFQCRVHLPRLPWGMVGGPPQVGKCGSSLGSHSIF